jgi:Ca2+-binding EF-hand superfamily protein
VRNHLARSPAPLLLRQMISDIDKDSNGSIDFEEFLDMMTAKMSDKDTREDINKVTAPLQAYANSLGHLRYA